jgi:uncharacterized protein involved in outer membrane biogenesis
VKKFIKIVLWAILVIFIVVGLSIMGLRHFAKVHHWDSKSTQIVLKGSGRNIIIRHGFQWDLFPDLQAQARGVVITNPTGWPGFFVSVGHMHANVQWWPLLVGHVEVNSASMSNAEFFFINSPKGNNWEWHHPKSASKLTSKPKPKAIPHATKMTPTKAIASVAAKPQNTNLSVKLLTIKNAALYYINEVKHQKPVSLKPFNLTLKNFAANTPFTLDASFNFGKGNIDLPVKIHALSTLTPPGLLTIQKATITIKGVHFVGHGTVTSLFDNPALHLKFVAKEFNPVVFATMSGHPVDNQVAGLLQSLVGHVTPKVHVAFELNGPLDNLDYKFDMPGVKPVVQPHKLIGNLQSRITSLFKKS